MATEFQRTIKASNIAAVKQMIDDGVDVNQQDTNGISALHYAGTVEIAQMLLDAHANIDHQQNHLNATPLMYAVKRSLPELVKLLLDRGADVNLQDKYGNTALHHVSDAEIAKMLIEAGVDVNHENGRGYTAIYMQRMMILPD